jgi:hypothetical protein
MFVSPFKNLDVALRLLLPLPLELGVGVGEHGRSA